MNPYKQAWYNSHQSFFNPPRKADSPSKLTYRDGAKSYYDTLWFSHHNLWNTYQTPAGQIFVDVTLAITLPPVALGRKAHKAIELGRYIFDTIQ